MSYIIGEIQAFPLRRQPVGWLPCDGRSLQCAGPYQPLFNIIGMRFGGDAAAGTFNLPDLRHAAVVGMDPRLADSTGSKINWAYGEESEAAPGDGLPVLEVGCFICVAGTGGPVVFRPPFILRGDDACASIDGTYKLSLRYGRAVVHGKDGLLIWESGGEDGVALALSEVGDLVLSNAAGIAVWQSGSQLPAGTTPVLLFRADGHLAIADSQGGEVWRSHNLTAEECERAEERAFRKKGWLAAGQMVKKGDPFLRFGNGAYELGLSDGGSAMLRDRAGKVLWRTLADGATSLAFRTDGELELRDGGGVVLWRSQLPQTGAGVDMLLQVTDDGDAVVTHKAAKSRETIWSGREALILERERLEQGRLNHGRTLTPEQALRSPNGRFVMTLSTEGGVVVKTAGEGKTLWSLGVQAGHIGRLAARTDGSLVLYAEDGKVLWAMGGRQYWEKGERHLALSDDGELSLFQGDILIWAAGSAPRPGHLNAGGRLGKGESLRSPSGGAILTLQKDGNLVLTDSKGKVLWMTGLISPRIRQLVMQQDGNLVLEDEDAHPVWATATDDSSPHAPAHSLKVDDDGTISVSAPAGGRSWRSGATAPDRLNPGQGLPPGEALVCPGGERLEVRRDGSLVLLNKKGREIWSVGTPGTAIRGLSLHVDGTLALVAADGSRVWSHTPSGDGHVRLERETLQHGRLVIAGPSSLTTGEVLDRASHLISATDSWKLAFRDDGALSLRRFDEEMWTNGVADTAAATMSLDDTDGLVVCDQGGRVIWRGTAQAPMMRKGTAARLVLDDDGNLKVCSADDEAQPLWQAPRQRMFPRGNALSEHDRMVSPNGRYHAFIGDDDDFRVVRVWDGRVLESGKRGDEKDPSFNVTRKKISWIGCSDVRDSRDKWLELTAHYSTPGGGELSRTLGRIPGTDGVSLALRDDGRLVTNSGTAVKWAKKVEVDRSREDLMRIWTQAVPDARQIVPTVLSRESAVFAAARGTVVRFDAQDGTLSGNRSLTGAGGGDVSLAASEAGLFAGADGQVWGLSPETLKDLWPTRKLPEGGGVTALLAIGNRLVAAPEGFIYGINARTGEVETSNPLQGMGHREVRLAACGDLLFAGTSGHVWAFPFASFNTPKWHIALPGGNDSVTSVLAVGEDVFAAANGFVHRVSQKTGEVLADNPLSGLGNHEARLAYADGKLHVHMNGQVLALKGQTLR